MNTPPQRGGVNFARPVRKPVTNLTFTHRILHALAQLTIKFALVYRFKNILYTPSHKLLTHISQGAFSALWAPACTAQVIHHDHSPAFTVVPYDHFHRSMVYRHEYFQQIQSIIDNRIGTQCTVAQRKRPGRR